ncbi:MAG: hypothetical protein K5989_11665, partial [Lachnospiraceae bacterium]|nr:hypothetical protein [Lachnospiraceae bacterium]
MNNNEYVKILYMDWKSFCSEDMIPAFEACGCRVIRVPFTKELDYTLTKGFRETAKENNKENEKANASIPNVSDFPDSKGQDGAGDISPDLSYADMLFSLLQAERPDFVFS